MKHFFSFLSIFSVFCLSAQQTSLLPGHFIYDLSEEWELQSSQMNFTAMKPMGRADIFNMVNDSTQLNKYDWNYLKLETRGETDINIKAGSPLFWGLYKYPSDMASIHTDNFDLHVNPVISWNVGKESAHDDLIFHNYRGFEFRGMVDKKVSFYTRLTENQARYPGYVRDITAQTLAVPYEGFWKQYGETGVDFLRAQAHINANLTKHINAELGYGKHFVGNGMRSLVLSDYGNNYPYLRIKTKVWKIEYTNLFATLTAGLEGGDYGLNGTGEFTKKHLAFHHLNINVAPKLNIGLFESVIYQKTDGTGLTYYNPIIFYRAVEHQDGSSGNALLGLDFKWNFIKNMSAYGQLVIDELIMSKVFSGEKNWENKQGFQLGLKYNDAFGLDGLWLQTEYNWVRPFTYAHESNLTAYSHYGLPLAHPLGANFKESMSKIRYRVTPKLTASAEFLFAQYGIDVDSISYGQDVLKPYVLKNDDINIEMLQGEKTDLQVLQATVSYHWFHNFFTDVNFMYRKEKSENNIVNKETKVVSVSLRYNFARRNYLF